ncbi:MAG TPA: ATP-binding cassette domain-containing protein, partial [Candidatus Acetothermia bacterium]|nr:ATP-binding cassette domain-containing protein [Candidatus Acetothermia bacterium]
MIDVDAVTIDYGQGEQTVRAVEDVSFRLDKGKSLALIGPSGCGKTSLLFALSGLLHPRSGKITLDSEEVTNPRRDVALILQNAGLLPWKKVWQNANLSLLLNGEFPQQNAAEVLAHLVLDNVMKRFPAELSEGMKRRVGIARALSTSPS